MSTTYLTGRQVKIRGNLLYPRHPRSIIFIMSQDVVNFLTDTYLKFRLNLHDQIGARTGATININGTILVKRKSNFYSN